MMKAILSLKKQLVIKEVCSWLQTFRPSNPGGNVNVNAINTLAGFWA